MADLEIIVDSHEQYPYQFTGQQVTVVKRALPCGDYGTTLDGRLVASVERKSLADLVGRLMSGKLRFALSELAALPRAAVVVEDRYSAVFKLERVRPAVVADGLSELQVRWPTVPIVFCDTRPMAEQWVYRYLAAAHTWAGVENIVGRRIRSAGSGELDGAPDAPGPTTAEVREWARSNDIIVPDRGRLRPEIWEAWRTANITPAALD